MTDSRLSPDVPPPTWDLLRGLADQPSRSDAWRRAGAWAFEVLEEHLGQHWPTRAWTQHEALPIPLSNAGSHLVAFADVLQLALEIHLLRNVPGWADVLADLRGDRRQQRALHSASQLQLAALGHRIEWQPVLEPAPRGGNAPPADLQLAAPSGELTIEVRVLLPSAASDKQHAAVDAVMHAVQHEALAGGVAVTGDLSELPGDEELADLVEWIRTSAPFVAAGGVIPPRRLRSGAALELLPFSAAIGRPLRGPRRGEDLWPRLRSVLIQKASRMASSGASWLRLEALHGLWRGTSWSRTDLATRLTALRTPIAETLGDYPHVGGVVVSSAAGQHLGSVREETVDLKRAGWAWRYGVTGQRAREVLVIPLNAACAVSENWRELHAAEPDWLPWAIAKIGLEPIPEFDEIRRDPQAGKSRG